MVFNQRGRGYSHRGRNYFYGRDRLENGRSDVFTSGPTGVFVPRGPSCAGQAFAGPVGFNSHLLNPEFANYRGRGGGRKFFGKRNNQQVPFQEIDLTKPWVTEEIRNENRKKLEFLETWKKTKSNEDWDKYKCQKLNVQALNEKAKLDYCASHPYEIVQRGNTSGVKQHYCEACDKSFKTEDDLFIHESEHETCYCDGCEFTAHPKIIAKHIKMQHESGLYNRIGKLYTQEDIAKWIEERKKRYPTRKVIEDKKILEEEKLKRGEKIKDDDSKFNKSFQNKNKNHRKKNFEKRTFRTARKRQMRKKNKTSAECSQVTEDQAEDFRKGVPAFSGIGITIEPELPEKSEFDISDDDWETECKVSDVSKPLLNSSLKLLAEFYNSDEESPSQPPQKEVAEECISADEESAPEEIKTFSDKCEVIESKSNDKKVPIKRKFLERQNSYNNKRRNTLNEYNSDKQNQSLLEKLLKNEIRRERNIILQCIQYVVNHDFFKA